jgi:serine/threonine protein kinase
LIQTIDFAAAILPLYNDFSFAMEFHCSCGHLQMAKWIGALAGVAAVLSIAGDFVMMIVRQPYTCTDFGRQETRDPARTSQHPSSRLDGAGVSSHPPANAASTKARLLGLWNSAKQALFDLVLNYQAKPAYQQPGAPAFAATYETAMSRPYWEQAAQTPAYKPALPPRKQPPKSAEAPAAARSTIIVNGRAQSVPEILRIGKPITPAHDPMRDGGLFGPAVAARQFERPYLAAQYVSGQTPAEAAHATQAEPPLPPKVAGPDQYRQQIGKLLESAGENLEALDKKSHNGVLSTAQVHGQLHAEQMSATRLIDAVFHADLQKIAHLPPPQRGPMMRELSGLRFAARREAAAGISRLYEEKGWITPPAGGNLRWERASGPLLTRRHDPLNRVRLKKANIGNGGFGSVSIYSTDKGRDIAIKVPHRENATRRDQDGKLIDMLNAEAEVYEKLFKQGSHPNIVNTYGIARIDIDGRQRRVLVMDAVEGPDGAAAFAELRRALDNNEISASQYQAVMSHISEKMLSAIDFLSQAGVVHNDIKPENFILDKRTGEPILVDFGLWSKTGAKDVGGTLDYAAAEAIAGTGVDQRTDVFALGASIVEGIDGGSNKFWNQKKQRFDFYKPKDGIVEGTVYRADENGRLRTQQLNLIKNSAYADFARKLMRDERDARPDAGKAIEGERFVADGLHHQIDAPKVLRELFSGQLEKREKPSTPVTQAEREKRQALINQLRQQPSLALFARLKREGKSDPQLKAFLAKPAQLGNVMPAIEREAVRHAANATARAPWLASLNRVLPQIPSAVTESGVDENGERLPASAGIKLTPREKTFLNGFSRTVPMAKVEEFVRSTAPLMRDLGSLENIQQAQARHSIKQLGEAVGNAKRVLEMYRLDQEAKAEQTPKMSIKDRARALEKP